MWIAGTREWVEGDGSEDESHSRGFISQRTTVLWVTTFVSH